VSIFICQQTLVTTLETFYQYAWYATGKGLTPIMLPVL